MKAVLRYLGGKNRLAPWIIRHFPVHTCYVEPYSGSLGVLLNKAPAPVEICNDKDGEIVNLFRVLRSEDAGRLLEAVMLTPYSRDELNDSALQGWHKDSIKTISNMASPRLECLWLNYNPQLTLF